MKKLLLIASVLVLCVGVNAQTNSVPSFFESAQSYFTSFDTNSITFTPAIDHFNIDLGTENVNNQNMNAIFGVSGKVYNNFWLKAQFFNTTAFGNITQLDGGVGYALVLYDVKVTPSVNGGYSWPDKSAYVRPDLDLRKAMTTHTYAGIGIDTRIDFKNQGALTPGFRLFTGFNF